MESSISNYCKTVSSFLTHVESSSKALADSIQRRPLPLDLAASSFLSRLDARISLAASDLTQLETMAFGTVSFEELIGHCDQIYKMNRGYVSEAEDRLKCFGYVPETVLDDEEGVSGQTPRNQKTESESVAPESVFPEDKIARKTDIDDFESMSLQDIGLSDACLATIASEGKHDALRPKLLSTSPAGFFNGGTSLPSTCIPDKDEERASCLIRISKDDFDKLPSYMKSLASYEDLLEAVAKLNPLLKKKCEGNTYHSFSQNDLELLPGFGRKGKIYVLMLLKMNRLTSETVGDDVFYSVV